ncbi:MAG: Fur family transcriptional regulator [Alphaproteobacteria bacterium]
MSKHTKHNHGQKINVDHLIDAVQEMSKARGERMTSVRRDVIVALARLKEPHGAYQILAELNQKRTPKLSAMSLYRTLDFLTKLGVVIKLESQNTYKLCAEHDNEHNHLMIICDGCGGTQEVDDLAASKKLQSLAHKHGHILKHHVIELHGLCASCTA